MAPTEKDLDSHLAHWQHSESVTKTISDLIETELHQAMTTGLEEIVQQVRRQAELDENRNSGVSDAELQDRINKAVAAATRPRPPESATKHTNGVFNDLKEMKTNTGARVVQNLAKR